MFSPSFVVLHAMNWFSFCHVLTALCTKTSSTILHIWLDEVMILVVYANLTIGLYIFDICLFFRMQERKGISFFITKMYFDLNHACGKIAYRQTKPESRHEELYIANHNFPLWWSLLCNTANVLRVQSKRIPQKLWHWLLVVLVRNKRKRKIFYIDKFMNGLILNAPYFLNINYSAY